MQHLDDFEQRIKEIGPDVVRAIEGYLLAVAHAGKPVDVERHKVIPESLNSLASRIGLSRTSLYRWKRGEAQPDLVSLVRIVEGLDWDLGKLLAAAGLMFPYGPHVSPLDLAPDGPVADIEFAINADPTLTAQGRRALQEVLRIEGVRRPTSPPPGSSV